jgi:hypothetical protein
MSSTTVAAIDRHVAVIDGGNNDEGPVRRVSDLRGMPFVVLLGEPGMGKSTVLEGEAAREGATVLKVRELISGVQTEPGAALFLDALDEYRTDGQSSDKVHTLAAAMTKLEPARWRLTCRSEDWRKGADIAPIRRTTSGAPIVVAQLLPLDHLEAAAILKALGEEDPEAFLARTASLGATAFVENPLSLTLLHTAVADGKPWPSTRFDLFTSATNRLVFERNEEHTWSDRCAHKDILGAAGEACLSLLVSGGRAIWRSNSEPTTDADARAYVTAGDLGLGGKLLSDMLDTALFRGEGEAFEPMHRTIAEFLAGRALANIVVGRSGLAALPLSRAIALVTGPDGVPPTELRGLYAWFAAHLTKLGDEVGALRLIEADAFTVLAYGDAAAFSTHARRSILANLDRNDPYFQASQVGITAVGGLARADLADDFAAILTGPSDGTHRLLVVFEALTKGPPVKSLRPILHAIAIDAARPEWQRRRAAEAWLNGADDPVSARRALFDALAGEAVSISREALRAELAADLPPRLLSVADVKSVVGDYQRCPEDNVMGRLFSLQRRLAAEPMPELFDEPLKSWLPENPARAHDIEVEHLNDYALAAAIDRSVDVSAARLWRWTVNVRDRTWSPLRDRTAKAVAAWLDGDQSREAAFFDAVLADEEPTAGPWIVIKKYVSTTGRYPSATVLRHMLSKAAVTSANLGKRRYLAIAVEIAHQPSTGPEGYWETYDWIAREPGCEALLKQLTTVKINKLRRSEQKLAEKAREREAREKASNVRKLAPALAEMRVGGQPGHLDWTARLYFEHRQDRPVGLALVVHVTDEATCQAAVAGWEHLATHGLGGITASMMGKAEAESQRYVVEVAAMAGVDRLISEGRMLELGVVPIEVAIAVLQSAFFIGSEDQRGHLEKWATNRLNHDPAAGAEQIIDFWGAALDVGATRLSGLPRLEGQASCDAVTLAIDRLLEMRPAMPADALNFALRFGVKHLTHARLLALAQAALGDTSVAGAQRTMWSFVASALDSASRGEQFIAEHDSGDTSALFDLIDPLASGFGETGGPAQVWSATIVVQLFGKSVGPEDDWPHGDNIMRPPRHSGTAAICGGMRACDEGRFLSRLIRCEGA